MKETEFVVASDNKTWMDTAVISDTPFKITIIDAIPLTRALRDTLLMLPCIELNGFSDKHLDSISRTMVLTVLTAIVNRRRAWVYGYDTEVEIHLMNLRDLIGYDIEAGLREDIRADLNDPEHQHISTLMELHLAGMLELMTKHMSPNHFAVHRLTQGRDMRTFNLEEYADWRVIQWTQAEQDKIASRHENI